MARKLSFLVVSDSGRFVRKMHCSTWLLLSTALSLFLLIASIPVGAIDYIRMSRKDLDKSALEAVLLSKDQEIAQYRRQIQKFAGDINQLKHRMVELDQIDRHIRRVAQLEQEDALFGIGGSTPEDIRADLHLKSRSDQLVVEMHRQLKELQGAYDYQHVSLNDLSRIVDERGNLMTYTPTIRPADGQISSLFGHRNSPFTGELEFHQGLDIANELNTEIFATAFGRIAYVGETPGFGKLVLIDHGHGFSTLYAHLDRILIEQGQHVKRAQVIGHMGSTGRSTGPHLHYEVRLNGVPVNPGKYFLN
jgi:murein DD-endopeptidase MepM/ murein hydrolase activator NlpD